jgi:selenocysteine lyase/cysteine desulfurase
MATPTFDLRPYIIGADQPVTLLDGSRAPYLNLDNAASTPALLAVKDTLDAALPWYSSVHRGSGFKSMLSTELYEQARRIVLDFVGADPGGDCVIFCKNTTEAVNHLARLYPFQPGDLVLTTSLEHHSNDLPWRARAGVLHAAVHGDGRLDLDDFAAQLEQHAGQIKLVAVSGASNVTGYLPPIHDLAELTHRYGARIFVDCAQLLPHRAIAMGAIDSPRRLDFIAFSAHKVYAPYGSGGLVGPAEFFNALNPDDRGGGTVEIVTLSDVTWTGAPERDEAGSPNVLGALALAAALKFLKGVGMQALADHEAELTAYALRRLPEVPGIQLYGLTDPETAAQRVGVIPFTLRGFAHGQVAAILGFEAGIGVRDGCFCAHPYILRLLGITQQEYEVFHQRVLNHNRADLPGLVRMSFGCYNTLADVDRLVAALQRIAAGDFVGEYAVHPRSGSYYPRGVEPAAALQVFSL